MPAGMLLPARQKALVMAGVMAALFLAALDQTIMGVAMPRVIADLGGLDRFAWPFTAYMLASTVVMPVVGKLSDIYGRKPMLALGIIIFVAGSALAGAAGSMNALIGFRGVQGLGAGCIMANAFAATADLFPPAERGRWTGILAGSWSLASIVGPLAGGALTDNLSWRWVFYLNVPVGALALAVVLFAMPWLRHHVAVRIDYTGAALIVGAAAPLLLALSWAGSDYPWTDVRVLASFAIAGVCLVAVIAWERGRPYAILPLGLFRNRVFAVSIVVQAVIGVGMFGVIQFMPLFLQGAQGVTATSSGLITMPMSAGWVTGSILSGQLIARTGRYRPIAIIGGLIMITGALLLSTLNADSSAWFTRGYMVVMGLGFGLTMPLYTLAVQNALPYSLLGVGTSALQFFRSIGGTMGVAIFGSLLTSRFAAALLGTGDPDLASIAARPQTLLDPDAVTALATRIDARTPGASADVIHTARLVLGETVTDLFVIAAVIAAVALVVAFLLPAIKHRTREELMRGMGAARPPSSGDAAPSAPPAAAPAGLASADRPAAQPRIAGAAPMVDLLPSPAMPSPRGVATETARAARRGWLVLAVALGVAVGLAAALSTGIRRIPGIPRS